MMDSGPTPRTFLAETRAAKLLDRFGISSPQAIVLEDLAYALGVEVSYKPLAGAEAHLVRVGDRGGITISTRIRERGRQRFAIAHELGHWTLHEDRTQFFLCTAEDMRDYEASPEEIEANVFASELLMPVRMMNPAYRTAQPGLQIPQEIAEAFDVSLTAATLRYVTKFKLPLMVAFSSNGRVNWWRRNEEEMEYLYFESGQALSPDSRAAAIAAGEPGDLSMIEVPWAAWFPHLDERAATLREQSLRFDHYDIVMSLLWLDPA